MAKINAQARGEDQVLPGFSSRSANAVPPSRPVQADQGDLFGTRYDVRDRLVHLAKAAEFHLSHGQKQQAKRASRSAFELLKVR